MRFRSAALLLFFAAGSAAAEEPAGTPPADAIPAFSGAVQKKVLSLMRQNRQLYGDDAAMLQGLLLMHSVEGEAVLATETQIVGFEDLEGRRYVAFRVASGVILDDRTLDRDARLERIWHAILEKTLLRYPRFEVPGDGIAVEIQYNHRPFASMSELYRTLADEGRAERAKFYLHTADLTPFLEHRLAAQEFLDRSRVLVDQAPVKVRLKNARPLPAAPAE